MQNKMPKILDGKEIREQMIPELSSHISKSGIVPVLAIVQVGDRPDSNAFIKAKIAFGKRIGAEVRHTSFETNIGQSDLIGEIVKLNNDPSVHGIIVQLPLPPELDKYAVIESILSKKDVDALTSSRVKKWLDNNDALLTATSRGIGKIFEYYGINLSGKKVTIVGRSMLVGKPIASYCINSNATVTVCHSKTADLRSETRNADIIIVAAGSPKLIGRDYVNKDQIVIDVGISKLQDGTISGDVNAEEISDIVASMTLVPGGVGPMTVTSLFANLIDLACHGK